MSNSGAHGCHSHYLFLSLCRNGKIDELKEFNCVLFRPCGIDSKFILEIVSNGHVNVLEWLNKKYSLDTLFEENLKKIMIIASENGHLNVLQWCIETFERKNIQLSFEAMSNANNVDVLDWWLNNFVRYELMYHTQSILLSCEKDNDVERLNWWVQHFGKQQFESLNPGRNDYNDKIQNWLNKNIRCE